ncbi:MAG: hypothetical protein M1423_07140 [Acidobacteria bacterium]|nr:hypothetical protein [Acidobacteriota bacterium]
MLESTHLFFILLVLVITFGPIVAIFWLIFSMVRRVKLARMQSELHSKLIDKIGSSPESLAYLNTEAGKQLVASMGIDQPRREPYSRILSSVQAGVILVLVGFVLVILGLTFANTKEGFCILGDLAVALGAGFLISAWISYRLSKKFGLLDRERAAENPLP